MGIDLNDKKYHCTCEVCGKSIGYKTPKGYRENPCCVGWCGRLKKFDVLIEKSRVAHDNFYKYHKTKIPEGSFRSAKVTITCPVHGDFKTRLADHARGHACPRCAAINRGSLKSEKAAALFKSKSKARYPQAGLDYSYVIYVNSETDVILICPKHGAFNTTPNIHLHRYIGCPGCSRRFIGVDVIAERRRKKGKEEYIERATEKHDGRYLYPYIEDYQNSKSKIRIVCPQHGVFKQVAQSHLRGCGCPKCNLSLGELAIQKFLGVREILHEQEYGFPDCKDVRILKFDFYLPELNVCIEYDGKQHYVQVDHFGGEEEFKKVKKRDAIKDQYCKDHGIKLIRIPYTDFDRIEEILEKALKKLAA